MAKKGAQVSLWSICIPACKITCVDLRISRKKKVLRLPRETDTEFPATICSKAKEGPGNSADVMKGLLIDVLRRCKSHNVEFS